MSVPSSHATPCLAVLYSCHEGYSRYSRGSDRDRDRDRGSATLVR